MIRVWTVYAQFEDSWHRIGVQPMTFQEADQLYKDIAGSYGLNLCVNACC